MAKGGFNRGGMNRNQMMAQARKMQEQLLAAQEKAALTLHTASAGGGAVKVTVSGDLRLTDLKIDPEVLDPDALESAEKAASQAMSSVTGGLNIPGLF